MDEESLRVVTRTAKERGSPCIRADDNASIDVLEESLAGQRVRATTAAASYGVMPLPLVGRHQVENLATALTAAETLSDIIGIPLDEDAVKRGVGEVRWHGRFQLLEEDPPVVVDGAHNLEAGAALAATLKRLAGDRPVGLVVGMCADKDAAGFLGAFASAARKLWLVPIRDERNMPPGQLKAAGGTLRCAVEQAELAPALASAREWARANGGIVCVTGSLYLVGEVLGDPSLFAVANRGRTSRDEQRPG